VFHIVSSFPGCSSQWHEAACNRNSLKQEKVVRLKLRKDVSLRACSQANNPFGFVIVLYNGVSIVNFQI
jgi:hypothetical protein